MPFEKNFWEDDTVSTAAGAPFRSLSSAVSIASYATCTALENPSVQRFSGFWAAANHAARRTFLAQKITPHHTLCWLAGHPQQSACDEERIGEISMTLEKRLNAIIQRQPTFKFATALLTLMRVVVGVWVRFWHKITPHHTLCWLAGHPQQSACDEERIVEISMTLEKRLNAIIQRQPTFKFATALLTLMRVGVLACECVRVCGLVWCGGWVGTRAHTQTHKHTHTHTRTH
jgi:hypothetical protein